MDSSTVPHVVSLGRVGIDSPFAGLPRRRMNNRLKMKPGDELYINNNNNGIARGNRPTINTNNNINNQNVRKKPTLNDLVGTTLKLKEKYPILQKMFPSKQRNNNNENNNENANKNNKNIKKKAKVTPAYNVIIDNKPVWAPVLHTGVVKLPPPPLFSSTSSPSLSSNGGINSFLPQLSPAASHLLRMHSARKTSKPPPANNYEAYMAELEDQRIAQAIAEGNLPGGGVWDNYNNNYSDYYNNSYMQNNNYYYNNNNNAHTAADEMNMNMANMNINDYNNNSDNMNSDYSGEEGGYYDNNDEYNNTYDYNNNNDNNNYYNEDDQYYNNNNNNNNDRFNSNDNISSNDTNNNGYNSMSHISSSSSQSPPIPPNWQSERMYLQQQPAFAHMTTPISPNKFHPGFNYATQFTCHYNYYLADEYVEALHKTNAENGVTNSQQGGVGGGGGIGGEEGEGNNEMVINANNQDNESIQSMNNNYNNAGTVLSSPRNLPVKPLVKSPRRLKSGKDYIKLPLQPQQQTHQH